MQGYLISRPLSWRNLLDFLGGPTGPVVAVVPFDVRAMNAAATQDLRAELVAARTEAATAAAGFKTAD